MINDLTAFLQQHDLQVTPQRLAILRVVTDTPHIAADHVVRLTRNQIGSISRQSVYNTLGTLVEKGLLRRIQPIGSPALYETRVGDNHHHLVCRDCGAVVDVDCAVGHTPCLTPSDDRGYQVDEADVTYWGRCPGCQEELGSDPEPDGPAHG